MKHEEASYHGTGGLELYYQCWQPDVESRAIVVIVHGVAEHSGRFMNLVDPLTTGGYAVYSNDHRGHGHSPGQRVHINQWGEYREDLRAFLEEIGKLEPGKPIFLYGHSMGSIIVLDYILNYPEGLRGAIISGVALEPVALAKPYLVALAWVLSRIWPRFSMNLGMDTKALSRDPAVVKAYETDPLVSRRATVRWGIEAFNAVAWIKAHASEISLPILLLHGDADRLNLVQGSHNLYEAMTHADKTLIIYPGGYHELHNDIDHEQVVNDIKEWLDRHF